MPTLHLMHGFLGAGKTTFAKQLETQLPAVRYTPDEWMVRLFGVDSPAEHFQQNLDAVFDIIEGHWPRVVACGVDVILDFGFWSRAARDLVRQRAAQLGCASQLYAVRCSEATARRRCALRNENLSGSLLITDNTFNVLQARFEPLGADEPFTLVATE
ncbi:MAG TPA: AAA family ATPase [Polyangiaceae bacterium]|nr:AAA family ATPase [Polyangiaceae bacterium]